jgi:hypothetical protein
MGNSFVKDINKVFGHSGQGGYVAGGSPDDWQPGSRDPDYNPGTPTPPPPPKVPQYVAPAFYSPKQSQLQSATYNPSSTSHSYLSRFGAAKHI